MKRSGLFGHWLNLLVLTASFAVGLRAATITTSTMLGVGDTSLDGQDVVVDNATLTLAGSHTFTNLQLLNGAVLTHEPATSGQAERAIRLTVTGNLMVDAASRMDATGKGYAEAASPGAGVRGNYAGGGGGHGGQGHRSAGIPGPGGPAFGSVIAPDSWGGPGGNSANDQFAPGGGLVHLEVGGTLTIAGAVRADGASAWIDNQGGGAGGTVYLKAATLAGAGTISANGGGGEWVDGGGGAGGRIALLYTHNQFSGALSAVGAGGAGVGGAGTIYLKQGTSAGELRVSNNSRGEWTPLTSSAPFNLVLDGNAIGYATEPLTIGSLTLAGAAMLTHTTGSTGLVVNASGNVTVGKDAGINVDGRGYPFDGNRGPGSGVRGDWSGTGASHGGWGGRSVTGYEGGPHYGSVLRPTALGSQGGDSNGGPGSAGGGAVRLTVGGTLDVQGRISANGNHNPADNAGGGSGGSIWITAATLVGNGLILADGGSGEWVEGGGGAGGRVALYFTNNQFTGLVTAVGGGGSHKGGAGTVYFKRGADAVGEVFLDNSNGWGNYTPLSTPEAFRLTITGRAVCYPETALTVAQFRMPGEAVLTQLTGQSNITLHVTGDAHIAVGAQLTVDGRGYPIGEDRGPGAGNRYDWSGSGGGHGGLGGTGRTGAVGGSHYGSVLQPTTLGSQGGNSTGGLGTAGGGAIRLVVDGQLTVNGRLSAEGAGAPPDNAGGGSGGSLWLTVGSLSGAGVISANGGPGEWVEGGGGSGGRIAIYYTTKDYAGTITAFGGPGNQRGGAGTIYSKSVAEVQGHLLVDNGGTWGNYTPLQAPEAYRVTLAGRASSYPEAALTLARLELPGEAVLTHLTGQSNVNLHVLGDLLVAPGSALSVEGRGYPIDDDRGPGAGVRLDWAGSGASHGGLGGWGRTGAAPSTHCGSMLEPTLLGSQGGDAPGGRGTAGGGAIRLIVDGTLTVDGVLNANGAGTPPDNAGGGSGGSIWLTVAKLAGTGTITANGGPGEWVEGGGGGGGRIALYYDVNEFVGTITTHGGSGNHRGGAGTIYTREQGSAVGRLLVNNGGAWGNYTPMSSPEPFQLTLAEMAYVYPTDSLTVLDLEVRTNATLTHLTGQARCEVTVLNNALVAEGGSIDVNGRGFPGGDNPGPGGGVQLNCCGSGGGHGGSGGRSVSGAVGGAPYGSTTEPLEHGSAGGSASGGAGGAGGGVVHLIVSKALTIDGRVSANGMNGAPDNQGGGSGGSIYLVANTLAGKGSLLADGGAGEWVEGGGGAGGRIALHASTLAFAGEAFARGGGGHQRGGAGTIYRKHLGQTGGELVLENGGITGALTPFTVPAKTRLILGGGASFYPTEPLNVVSLELKPGATLTHINGQSGLFVTVEEDLTVAAGAAISVDGRGFPVGDDPGPGAGVNGPVCGSGGAHGGNGGIAWPGDVAGGQSYGSLLEPTEFGSSGGGSVNSASRERSPGGGAIRLVAGGTLTLDGSLSANGSNHWYDNQGGAAGGSIWVTAGTLAGTGAIAANGGTGEWVDGGSGGGGRIALYLEANQFTGTVTARGGGPGRQAGGAGTIYTKLEAKPVGQLLVENGNNWGAFTPLLSPVAFDVQVAARAQVFGAEPLVLQSLEVGPESILTHLKGDGGINAVVLGDVTIKGHVNADGLGYPVGGDPGPGTGGTVSWSGGGAGHGGDGHMSVTGAPGGLAYGSALEPSTPGSQGGAGSGGPGTDGGGVVRMIAGGTLTLDGAITANALGGPRDNAGGGSGGSILLNARTFAGGGEIRANGGPGEWVEGGSGAGGRIAIYRTLRTFTGAITADGAGGDRPGGPGTIHEDSVSTVIWLAPGETWLAGEVPVEIALFVSGTAPFTAEFSAWRDGVATSIGTMPALLVAGTKWNTVGVADGPYELRAVVRDASGYMVAENRRSVAVNNSVRWHNGPLANSETWEPGRVHVVSRELSIGDGRTLTLQPGTIVKFLPGARLSVLGGGTLVAPGTAGLPVHLTSFWDDSVGGDSNLDGDATRPTPGSWRVAVNASAALDTNEHTRFRFNTRTYGGTLASDETWTSDSLREITDVVVVPSGVTLTIQAGAILKFKSGMGVDVQAGGRLVTRGTAVQPVIFTSFNDDAWGGDTNEDGSQTKPNAGDWRSLRFVEGAQGDLVHTRVLFGGNSVGNPWGAGGVIEALGGTFTARNCVIADALKDGAFCYGTTRFENCLVLRCDRGLTAVGEMTVLNCTLDGNKIGLLEHVGHLIVQNTIVSGSIQAGIEHDLGGWTPTVTYCNVWNPDATRGNCSGTADVTGQAGNLSAEPRYKDPEADNFRLNFASPGIDAADGGLVPALDFAGMARYDDPRTGNTGTPAANGAVPDIGAFEFVETAPSNIDLVVLGVFGPGQLTAGGLVHVEWTIANHGAEAFTGPWHDGLFLRNATTGERLSVAEVLVGRSTTLAPGQTYLASADVRVPGGVSGNYTWQVMGNSRGDIFEGPNAANNQGDAGVDSSLAVPLIPLDGAAMSASFAAQEESQWFECLVPAGKDVRFNLDLLTDHGVTELYVGRGFMPTPEKFTARQREWSSPDTSAVVSGAGLPTGPGETNAFYLLAIGRKLPTVPQAFTISAATATFSFEGIWPATVGNAGEVTLDIRGAGFTTNTTFTVSRGADRRTAVRQSGRESGRVFATFDLAGFPSGRADLVAEEDGLQVVLPEALEVVEGGAPDFYVNLSGPGTTRAGRFMSWFVTYGNRGLVDIRLPLLKFSAPGATEISLYESTLNWADSFTFWGLNPEALLPTLGPGQEVTFEVRVKTFTAATITVQMMTGEQYAMDPTPFNWDQIPPTAGADPTAWAAMVGGLDERLGASLGEYEDLLEADLADLATSPLRYSYLANINGRWLFGEEVGGVDVSVPIITVPEDYQEPGIGNLRGPALHGSNPGDGIRKTWWLVITLEDYEYKNGDKEGDLPGCTVDARDLHDYAHKDLRTPREQYLWAHDSPDDGQRVTRDTMLNGIRSLKGKVDGDDNLVIVYSGHGGRKPSGAPYLVFNGDNASPVAFTQAIDEVGAGTTYFVNNSCHSEGFNELVTPSNTTFVGFAATTKERVSWSDDSSGGVLISNLKRQLRRCRGLGRSFEVATDVITATYKDQGRPEHRQQPVLTNPSGASLDGKPWNDPAGIEQQFNAVFRSPPFPGVIAAGTYMIVGSVDPNDKYALAGAGPEHWINTDQVLPFEVLFENKPTAAAAAQEVLVTDILSTNLDWSTFELKTLAFNDARITVPPGLQRFYATAQVGTDPNPVAVEVSFDSTTGQITWLMWSRDPNTGELPEDPFAGFLPPNDATHRGEGSLTYTIRPKLELADGTKIRNQATIIFDPTYGANPPILTPVVTNTVDSVAPSSQVQPLPAEATGPTVEVVWGGQDAPGGSGIASHDVFVSKNGAAYQLWQIAATTTQATFTGQPGASYRFYSVARDVAGNTETAPAAADTSTAFPGGTTFETWIASQGVPASQRDPSDDPEQDGLANFAEYAYALNPMVKDAALARPKAGLVQMGATTYLSLTYRRPKTEPTDAQYLVTRSDGVKPWAGTTTVTPVGTPVDRGTYVEVTVRSVQPISAKLEGYLRLEVRK